MLQQVLKSSTFKFNMWLNSSSFIVLYDGNSVHNIVGYSRYWNAWPLTCDSILTHLLFCIVRRQQCAQHCTLQQILQSSAFNMWLIPTHWCHECSPPQWTQVEAGLSRWWRTHQSGHLCSAKLMKDISIRTSLLCKVDDRHINQDIFTLQSGWRTHQSGHLYSAKLMKDTSIRTSLLCKADERHQSGHLYSVRTSLLCKVDEGHNNQDIFTLQSWWRTHQSGHLYSAKCRVCKQRKLSSTQKTSYEQTTVTHRACKLQ